MTALRVLRKDIVHALSNAIADIVADVAYLIQPGKEGVPAVDGQCNRDGMGLLERMYQGVEVTLVIVSVFATEPRRPLAIENHQFCQATGFADGLLVIGNGLLGFGDGGVPIPKDVRPKPAIDSLPVRFQDVLAQAQTGVKKHLIILVRSVEILDQAQQSCTIKRGELGLDIYPRRVRFRWTFDPMRFDSTNGAFWMVGADVESPPAPARPSVSR